MCTSIISNRKKTIVEWNLDILDVADKAVYWCENRDYGDIKLYNFGDVS